MSIFVTAQGEPEDERTAAIRRQMAEKWLRGDMCAKPRKPAHYAEVDPYALMESQRCARDFYRGQVVKYAARAGRKEGSDTLADLAKARDTLEKWIAYERSGGDG